MYIISRLPIARLEVWSGTAYYYLIYLDGIRIDLRVSTFIYAKEKALLSQSPPPLSTLQQYPHSIERLPVTSHSSSSYDSCVSLCYLR